MTDRITLSGVKAFGHHGVLPEERRDGQDFVTDVEMEIDLAAAAAGDDLTQTVDYAAVAGQIVEIVEGEPFHLIETLAQQIAVAVLTHDRVRAVRVTVHKPQAPVGVPFTDVSVTVERRR